MPNSFYETIRYIEQTPGTQSTKSILDHSRPTPIVTRNISAAHRSLMKQ